MTLSLDWSVNNTTIGTKHPVIKGTADRTDAGKVVDLWDNGTNTVVGHGTVKANGSFAIRANLANGNHSIHASLADGSESGSPTLHVMAPNNNGMLSVADPGAEYGAYGAHNTHLGNHQWIDVGLAGVTTLKFQGGSHRASIDLEGTWHMWAQPVGHFVSEGSLDVYGWRAGYAATFKAAWQLTIYSAPNGGHDTFTGGRSSDYYGFQTAPAEADNVITNFQRGMDHIAFDRNVGTASDNNGVHSFSDLHIDYVKGSGPRYDAQVFVNGHDTPLVTLQNVANHSITASDFLFNW